MTGNDNYGTRNSGDYWRVRILPVPSSFDVVRADGSAVRHRSCLASSYAPIRTRQRPNCHLGRRYVVRNATASAAELRRRSLRATGRARLKLTVRDQATDDSPARTVLRSVVLGMFVMLAGTMPRNLLFAANIRYHPDVPWAVPLVFVYLWIFWKYLNGAGPPSTTSGSRRTFLRARGISGSSWLWSLVAGGLGIVALVSGLDVVNRLLSLPQQNLPDLSQVPSSTVLSLLLAAAPVAGVVEEAAFRGYMQGPLEARFGLPVAILVVGTMFALAHLDFTLVLWPYYVSVAALYGTVTYVTRSILPAIVLHTAGNIYSNIDIWLHGRAEWQASAQGQETIWSAGLDASFLSSSALSVVAAGLMVLAFRRLSSVCGRER